MRAHRPKRVNNYEWAHDRPMASAANTNKWAHYISVNACEWAHDRCYCNIYRWAHYVFKKNVANDLKWAHVGCYTYSGFELSLSYL